MKIFHAITENKFLEEQLTENEFGAFHFKEACFRKSFVPFTTEVSRQSRS